MSTLSEMVLFMNICMLYGHAKHVPFSIHREFKLYTQWRLLLCMMIIKQEFDTVKKYFYSSTQFFVVSEKYIDPCVLESVISNTTGNNQWEIFFV